MASRKFESLSATKWMLNRILGECLLQHFYDWLHFASTLKNEIKEYEELPFSFYNEVYFIIRLPRNGEMDKPFELFFWDDFKHIRNLDSHNMKCPHCKLRS